MERAVILLQSINKLGNVGDEITVKAGFARNFLIPSQRAIYATASNRTTFAERRKQIEAKNQEHLDAANKIAQALPEQLVCVRQAAEDGHLFGSVNNRDIVELINAKIEHKVERSMVDLQAAIKQLGVYEVNINIYGPVVATVAINVARSTDEAELQWQEHNGEAAEDETSPSATPAATDNAGTTSDDSNTAEV